MPFQWELHWLPFGFWVQFKVPAHCGILLDSARAGAMGADWWEPAGIGWPESAGRVSFSRQRIKGAARKRERLIRAVGGSVFHNTWRGTVDRSEEGRLPRWRLTCVCVGAAGIIWRDGRLALDYQCSNQWELDEGNSPCFLVTFGGHDPKEREPSRGTFGPDSWGTVSWAGACKTSVGLLLGWVWTFVDN